MLAGVATVGHHRGGVGVLAGDLRQTQFDDLRDLVRACGPWRCTASTTGAPRLAAMRALTSTARWARDVGVVAADDQHRIALARPPGGTVDDVAERGVGVLVQLLVADADALLVGQPRGGVGEQQSRM